jgi:hypothetical protein
MVHSLRPEEETELHVHAGAQDLRLSLFTGVATLLPGWDIAAQGNSGRSPFATGITLLTHGSIRDQQS